MDEEDQKLIQEIEANQKQLNKKSKVAKAETLTGNKNQDTDTLYQPVDDDDI